MTDIHNQILDPERTLKLVREYIDNYNITDVDVIYDSARVIEQSGEFIESLCNAAGWAEPEIDEDEDITGSDYDEDNPAYMDEDY